MDKLTNRPTLSAPQCRQDPLVGTVPGDIPVSALREKRQTEAGGGKGQWQKHVG